MNNIDYSKFIVTREFLRKNPDHIFVFGDNLVHNGYGGAASLRDEPNTYGFITKKRPSNHDSSFYKPHEYHSVFYKEIDYLNDEISSNPDKIYLISKLGAGLANKFQIWEVIIEPYLKQLLSGYSNVKFLF